MTRTDGEVVGARKAYTRLTLEEARNIARRMGDWSTEQFAEEANVSYGSARNWMVRLIEQGYIQIAVPAMDGNPAIFEYLKPIPKPVNRPKQETPEQQAVREASKMKTACASRASARGKKKARPKSSDRETDDLIKLAWETDGWRVTRERGNYIKLLPPSGRPAYCAITPSDWRAVKNLRAELKRLGLPVGDERRQA